MQCNEVYVPQYLEVLTITSFGSRIGKLFPCWPRTQWAKPASPNPFLGKEIEVFAVRLEEQFNLLTDHSKCCKFGGAKGNIMHHKGAYPQIDWKAIWSKILYRKLGLTILFHYHK